MGKVAAIQMTSGQDVQTNLAQASPLIAQAVDKGAELIILPEMFGIMCMDQSEKLVHRESLGNGPIQDFLQSQAQQHKVWILGGTLPLRIHQNEEQVYAASLVYNGQGEQVARYNKIHLFDVFIEESGEKYQESEVTQHGDKLCYVDTPCGRLGLAVCYDLRFPELFRALAKQGAEIIAVPSAFTVPTGNAHWQLLMRARAVENLCYMVGACQGGVHPTGRATYGHSLMVEPWGEVLQELDDKPGLIVQDLDLEQLHKLRREFPALDHVRPL